MEEQHILASKAEARASRRVGATRALADAAIPGVSPEAAQRYDDLAPELVLELLRRIHDYVKGT